jgi:aminopeptidase N
LLKGAIVLQEIGVRHGHPKLKELVVEASRALSRLDADRLEELALSCQALNRALVHEDAETQAALAAEAKDATGDMAVLSRVLEATRANLSVMSRLRDLRAGRLEYREGCIERGISQASAWRRTESGHGDN